MRYRVRGQDWAISAFVHRDSGHDGYLIATLATPAGLAEADIAAKDVTLVLDRSGSMSGEPLRRARLAAQAVVARLRAEDRVNVLAFDDDVDMLYPTPQLLTDAVRAQADTYIAQMSEGGGTNIALTLERALAAQDRTSSAAGAEARPHVILFLTDGQSDAQAALEIHPEADAIYIACPRWPSVDVIAALEADTGKAVVAAPAAMVWGALKALRIGDCKPGFGRLMESLRAGSVTGRAV